MAPTTSHESLGWLIARALFQCRPRFIFDYLRNDYIFGPQLLCNRFPPGLFANLPTLDSSKTEFLIIDLNRQLSKIDNSSPFILHATLVLFLMNIIHVPSLIRFHHFLSPVILMSANSAVSILSKTPYFDSKTASTIAASIVHSKLDYCNSLCYNLHKSQINRLQQIQNCLALCTYCFQDFNLYRNKWALTFVCSSFFLYFFFLATCHRLSWSHSAFESTLNSLAYRIVSKGNSRRDEIFILRFGTGSYYIHQI